MNQGNQQNQAGPVEEVSWFNRLNLWGQIAAIAGGVAAVVMAIVAIIALFPKPVPPPPPSLEPTAVPAVVIRDIEYKPETGDDCAGEYVLLANKGPVDIELRQWQLADKANHVYTFPDFVLPAGAEVKVWTTSGQDSQSDLYWGCPQSVWNNDGDTAVLSDKDGQAIDSYTYP